MKKKIVTAATLAVLSTAFAGSVSANTYIVQKGDTLSHIAIKYKTNIAEIKRLNSLNSDLIYINQKLVVSNDSVGGDIAAPSTGVSVVPTATMAPAPAETAKTYTVVSGDNLSSIAKRHGITLSDLMSWNNLSGHLIYPGNVLKVSKPVAGSSTPVQTLEPVVNQASSSNPVSSGTVDYLIVRGDTLSRIAVAHGTTVQNIKIANNLSSDTIYAGQTLKVPTGGGNGNVAAAPVVPVQNQPSVPVATPIEAPSQVVAPAPTSEMAKLIEVAKSVMGTPYVWAGTSPSGFDCSGYVYYVFNQSGKQLPRTSAEGYYNRSYYVSDPVPGDLIFFENTYKKGISHLGIYLGNNQFIHADSSGVRITDVNNSYYKQHFDGYKRFY